MIDPIDEQIDDAIRIELEALLANVKFEMVDPPAVSAAATLDVGGGWSA